MKTAAVCATVGLILGTAPGWAGDPATGEALYGETCANCHGPTAKGMASYPKLVGHEATYLTDRLETYRAGQKVGPNSALMIPMATDLSDDDITNLVAFLTAK